MDSAASYSRTLDASSLSGRATCTSPKSKPQMRGTTRAWWGTWWPTPQCSALRPPWWCGGTVSAHSLLLRCLLVVLHSELTHTAEGEGRGAEINHLSPAWHCFCFCLLARFPHLLKNFYKVMYERSPLYLHEGTYLHNQKCSLLWQKCVQAHTPSKEPATHTQPHQDRLCVPLQIWAEADM